MTLLYLPYKKPFLKTGILLQNGFAFSSSSSKGKNIRFATDYFNGSGF